MHSGPSCLKLKLLANVTLKFRIMTNMCYSHLSSKNINVFDNALAITVNEFVINDLDKLTMLSDYDKYVLLIFVQQKYQCI